LRDASRNVCRKLALLVRWLEDTAIDFHRLVNGSDVGYW
jgi:hypothetical protein